MPKQPTVEEVKEQFRQAGFRVGEWNDQPETDLKMPESVKKIASGMEKVKGLVEMEIKKNQATMARAAEELARLEKGGASGGGR